MIKGVIFDLDGVVVDTAKYHFLAWKRLAEEFNYEFTEKNNELLKGVSRVRSLEIILELAGINLTENEKSELAEKKNNWYVEYILKMDESEILPGVVDFINLCKGENMKVALGSASKNAELILKNLKLLLCFDVIVDGNKISAAKPDPEVFLKAASELNLKPENCVVFEDAEAGVEAARRGKFHVIGIGSPEILKAADYVIPGFKGRGIELFSEM
ncbi:MAG: beta-phosphoglucomutase [Spirochaetes bacterium]|nr:beta-phosphoglucomutase [Spirochaetota bacterium]